LKQKSKGNNMRELTTIEIEDVSGGRFWLDYALEKILDFAGGLVYDSGGRGDYAGSGATGALNGGNLGA
jgi:hypothetical protein